MRVWLCMSAGSVAEMMGGEVDAFATVQRQSAHYHKGQFVNCSVEHARGEAGGGVVKSLFPLLLLLPFPAA